MRAAPAGSARAKRFGAGYTLIEMCITVLIVQLIAGMVVVNIGDVEASERVDRAAQETIVALRYARMLAMSSGQPCGVEFDTLNQRVRVFQGTGPTAPTATNALLGPGQYNYILNFTSKRNVKGVKITSVLLSNVTGNPYQCAYGKLGATPNNGYVTLSYGHTTKTIMIPLVGDPRVQ